MRTTQDNTQECLYIYIYVHVIIDYLIKILRTCRANKTISRRPLNPVLSLKDMKVLNKFPSKVFEGQISNDPHIIARNIVLSCSLLLLLLL
jgi:hypothetical protein